MTPRDLFAKWAARRDELAALKASVDGAALCADVLNDLHKLVTSVEQETVTLAEAARMTGYSKDHLGRLVRAGHIQNVGRKHRPLVVVQDLPVRPRAIADGNRERYDPATDARFLRVRR